VKGWSKVVNCSYSAGRGRSLVTTLNSEEELLVRGESSRTWPSWNDVTPVDVPLVASSSELFRVELLPELVTGAGAGLERDEKIEPPEKRERERARPSGLSSFLIGDSVSERVLPVLRLELLLLTWEMRAGGDSGIEALRGL
jgi:hypothetical protein